MTNQIPSSRSTRKVLMGTATAFGLAGAMALGSVLTPATPVYAEAVKVQAQPVVDFADVVQAVSPAVVSVRVSGKPAVRPTNDSSGGLFGFDSIPKDHPLRKFFDIPGFEDKFSDRRKRREDRRSRRGGDQVRPMGQGSGFFVTEDGYMVTNNHVVAGGEKFTIVLNDGKEYDAKMVGTDKETDLAVLKVDADRKFKYVEFDKDPVRVGGWVVAVGNPFGLGGTVTAGIVSADGRDIGSGRYDDFIQIDAAVNRGNSGGPAFNLNGEVIGVNTAIFSPSGGNVGIAFAIAARTAQEVVDDLINNGTVTRGWLGVSIQPVTSDIAESVGFAGTDGAIVAEPSANSPAQKAGIKAGDIITQVDDEAIESPKELARVIAGYEPKDVAKIKLFRDGKEITLDVKLGLLPGQKAEVASITPGDTGRSEAVELDQFGLSVAEADSGVVVADVFDNGTAARKGVRPGDQIVSINGRKISSVNSVGEAVARAMEDDRKAILFQIKSGDRNRFVAMPIG